MSTYQISPSDLTFLWDSCKLCFYLKIKHKIAYSGIFPSMFSKMADLTSHFYQDQSTREISPALPAGKIAYREKWVKSAPIMLHGGAHFATVRGRFDAVAAFEDGSFGIIDYKTSESSREKADFYSRQLSGYAYALENPATGALSLTPITRLGLFIVTPETFELLPDGRFAFVNKTAWLEVQRDDAAFLSLLDQVVSLLEADTHPAPSDGCTLCKYRQKMQYFSGP
jgi:hypothetical protein